MVADEKTNPNLRALIRELRASHDGKKVRAWSAVARRLERPRHKLRPVNISHVERVGRIGELIIVPTKLLGEGEIHKPVKVAALGWSEEAGKKIAAAGGSLVSLSQAFHDNPEAKGVHIIG